MSATESQYGVMSLHALTFVEEPQGVMVGRAEIGSYAIFPEAGAEAVRHLLAGMPLADVGEWYEARYGDPLDLEDLRGTLAELGFLRQPGDPDPLPVRGQRLGRWAFSPPAWAFYLAVTVGASVLMMTDITLRPSYRTLFFTSHMSLINVSLALGQFPCIALHEFYHSLAGRRLGLPSRFSVGRRLYYLVAETQLNSLYSVPRRQRYLPFLAGSLMDIVSVSILTLLCAVLRAAGAPPWLAGYALALAFTGVLRLLWQLLFYLETDLYFVISTAVGSTDLQNAARYLLRCWVGHTFHRSVEIEPDTWTDHDLRVARFYAPLLVLGYAFSIATLLWAGLPATVRFVTTLWHRFDGSRPLTIGLFIDSVVFILLSGIQLALLGYFTIRDWRAKRRTS
jgi:hypothetical protein